MKATPGQIKKMEELGLHSLFDNETTVEEARQILTDNLPRKSETKRIYARDLKGDNLSVNSDWND